MSPEGNLLPENAVSRWRFMGLGGYSMSNDPKPHQSPSRYERQALQQFEHWKHPKASLWSRAVDLFNRPFSWAGDFILDMPGVGWVLKKSIEGVVDVANDAAQWSVRPEAVYEEYRKDGHAEIRRNRDILRLDLQDVDRTIGYLGAKYKALAATEGAAFGAMGVLGIPLDIVSLTTLNLRAIGEYATYCGYDTTLQQERFFALQVLGYASSPTDATKGLAMGQLSKVAKQIAQKKTWSELEQHAFVKVIQAICKALGIRLTKAKLAQIVPVSGALVGGGFNSYFTSNVCEAAFMLYRERFLADKYGDEIIGEVRTESGNPYPEADDDLPEDGSDIPPGPNDCPGPT